MNPPSEPETLVIFRRYKDGEIVALFPYLPADVNGFHCVCYAHVGQHGGADPFGTVRQTRPASPEEYAPLHRELTGRGYNLRVIRRTPTDSYQRRWEDLAR